MNENNTPNVEIETTREGYRVTVNGKPVTGPLPSYGEADRKAKKVTGALGNRPPFPFGLLFGILVILAVVAGFLVGTVTGNWSLAVSVAIYGFFGALVMSIWVILTNTKE